MSRALGSGDSLAAEVLVERALRYGIFIPTERGLLYRLLDQTICLGRTRLYARKFEELCDIFEIHQKKLYGYLAPLLKDAVLARSVKGWNKGCGLWLAFNPPHQWDPVRRLARNERIETLCRELLDYDPDKGQDEFWDWPSLAEVMRENFLQAKLAPGEAVTQGPGGNAGHPRSGVPGCTTGSKDGSRDSGSADGNMLAPAGDEELLPPSQSGVQRVPATSEQPAPAAPLPVPHTTKVVVSGRGMAEPDTTRSVVVPDTTKVVVWESPGKSEGSSTTTKSVVSPGQRAAGINDQYCNDGTEYKYCPKGVSSSTAGDDTTKSVVSARNKPFTKEQQADWNRLIMVTGGNLGDFKPFWIARVRDGEAKKLMDDLRLRNESYPEDPVRGAAQWMFSKWQARQRLIGPTGPTQ